jgi:hypothetical protein
LRGDGGIRLDDLQHGVLLGFPFPTGRAQSPVQRPDYAPGWARVP